MKMASWAMTAHEQSLEDDAAADAAHIDQLHAENRRLREEVRQLRSDAQGWRTMLQAKHDELRKALLHAREQRIRAGQFEDALAAIHSTVAGVLPDAD